MERNDVDSYSWLGAWRVEAIDGDPVVDRSPATIALNADGTFSGNASINRLTGRWTASGDELELAPGALTRMAGPPALMDQERRYLDALERVASAALRNGRLELRDADGVEILVATRDDG